MSRYDPANEIFMEHVACQALDDLQENEKKTSDKWKSSRGLSRACPSSSLEGGCRIGLPFPYKLIVRKRALAEQYLS